MLGATIRHGQNIQQVISEGDLGSSTFIILVPGILYRAPGMCTTATRRKSNMLCLSVRSLGNSHIIFSCVSFCFASFQLSALLLVFFNGIYMFARCRNQ